jgi:methyl-accepting chemotaxis protein
VHAYVERWYANAQEERDHLQRAHDRVIPNSEKAQHIARKLAEVLKRVEELEQIERDAERIRLRLEREAKEVERMRASTEKTRTAFKGMTSAAQQVVDEFAEVEKAAKDMQRAMDRVDSLVGKSSKPPSWADMNRTSKRKYINPKGQRR